MMVLERGQQEGDGDGGCSIVSVGPKEGADMWGVGSVE